MSKRIKNKELCDFIIETVSHLEGERRGHQLAMEKIAKEIDRQKDLFDKIIDRKITKRGTPTVKKMTGGALGRSEPVKFKPGVYDEAAKGRTVL